MPQLPYRSLPFPTPRVPRIRGGLTWPRFPLLTPPQGGLDPLLRLPPPGRNLPGTMPTLLPRRVPLPSTRSSLARPSLAPLRASVCPRCSGRSRTRTATGCPQAQAPVPPLRVGAPTPELPSCCRARLRDSLAPSVPPVPAVVRWPPPPGPGNTRRELALPPWPPRPLLTSHGRTLGRSQASQSATLPLLLPLASVGSSRGVTPPPLGRLYPLGGRRSPLRLPECVPWRRPIASRRVSSPPR